MGHPKQHLPVWAALLAVVLVLFLLLPVATVLWRGTQTGGAIFGPVVQAALVVSAQTTATTLLLAVLFGTPLAYALARLDFFGKTFLNALLDLPVVLPPVVAGLGLLLVFGRNGVLGPGLRLAGLELAFSPAAVVMAQLFVAGPFFVRAAMAGFAAIETETVQAALVDGASNTQAFWWVIWPLAWPALLEGMVLAWARALGEFGATVLFAGSLEGRTRTMTLAVYSALESDLDAALVLAALMVSVAFVVLLVFRVWGKR